MSPPHLCWPKRYAMSPPVPCFPTNVCKVATWPYLEIVETGLGFIYLWSINFWMSSWKKTDTNNTMDVSELSQGQAYMYMQCRHRPPTSTNIYAMSPPEPCFAKSVCKVATFLFFEWKVMCNVAMWPPSFQSSVIRSHYAASVILGLRGIASYFVCSVAMWYLL